MRSPLVSYSEARRRVQSYLESITSSASPSGDGLLRASLTEWVPLFEAHGRVLAEPVVADRDQPPFPRATRDGFACRAVDANSNELLRLAGAVRAGEVVSGAGGVAPGELWEIMTGAPVPPGADAVFMVEHSERSSDGVRLATPRRIQAGENIVPQGVEARGGDLLIPAGVRVGAAQIALAAQCGYARIAVRRLPRVAILSTGDELVAVEAVPGASQIRNSNSPMLAALVAEAGGVPVARAAVADEEPVLDAAIAEARGGDQAGKQACEMLLITGGISAGRFDLVEDALLRAGARFLFKGVAMQPGKPVAFGEVPRPGLPGLPFVALPGNPISSAVTFLLFAAPVLAALGGDSTPQPRFAMARIKAKWEGKPGLTRFLPAICDFNADFEGEPGVGLVAWQGSGDIAAFARCTCFLVIPSEAERIEEGAAVRILLL